MKNKFLYILTSLLGLLLVSINISNAEPLKLHDYNNGEDLCSKMLFDGKRPTTQEQFNTNNISEDCSKEFVSGYTTQGNIGLWSAQHITKDDVLKYKEIKRKSKFDSRDQIIKSYVNSGYDRGHLTPSSNSTSYDAQKETFTWKNIAPQNHKLNNGRWKRIEGLTKTFATLYNDIYVVTGVLFDVKQPQKSIGQKEVAVPTAFWKAVLIPQSNHAFVTVCYNTDYDPCRILTLNQFEKNTGVYPFPGLDKRN